MIPIAVTKEISKEQINKIINLLDEKTMVIASVDFSHYLNLEDANNNDEITKDIIKVGAYDTFFSMSDAYFDSPGSLYMVFAFSEEMGYETYFLDHSNSAYYGAMKVPETTSYFIIGFK